MIGYMFIKILKEDDGERKLWRQEKRQDFGWSVEGARDIKAFWLPHVTFVDPEQHINGNISASTADILLSKIASYPNEITVTRDFINALSVGGYVKAFRIDDSGGGYLVVLAASLTSFHRIGYECSPNEDRLEETIKKALANATEAIRSNRTETLKSIVNEYPEILYLKDNQGDTPAIVAVRNRSVGCLRCIAEKAPETFGITTLYGATPAIIAANNELIDCLKIIADKTPKTLAIADNRGVTPAMCAVSKCDIECLKIIAGKAPETFLTANKNGETPATVAAFKGSVECLQIIAEKVPQTLAIANKDGWTPAIAAAWKRSIDCINYR